MRQLGAGPQAQAMQSVQRMASGVGEGLKSMAGGFGNAVTSIFGFSAVAGLVPVALAGMAASFATSGVNEFASSLNALGREADQLGTDLAQYKANIEAVKTAGLSESEARNLLQRFTAAQTELSRTGSKTRNDILALYQDPDLQRQIADALVDVMLAPTEAAMISVQDMAKEYGESRGRAAAELAESQKLSAEDAVAFINREIKDAEAEWLRRFNNVGALANVARSAIREVTDEERAMIKARRDDSKEWGAATSELSAAWGQIKDSISAIVIRPMIPVVQAIATGMRTAATAVQQIEQWFRSPGEGLLNLVERIQGILPSWATSFQPIRDFLASENPGKALLDMMLQLPALARQFIVNFTPIGAVMRTLLPQSVIDFFLNPSGKIVDILTRLTEGVPRLKEPLEPVIKFFEDPAQGIIDIFNWLVEDTIRFKNEVVEIGNKIAEWIPEPVKEFFRTAGTALYNTVTWIGDVIKGWVIEPIQKFFAAPEQNLYNMINWMLDKWEALGRGIESVKEFFSNPAPALLDMVNTIVDKMADFIPEPVKRFLGIGGAATTAPTGAELFGGAHGGGGIPEKSLQEVFGDYDEAFKKALEELAAPPVSYQHGGIVTQPTRALIGEAGPEAVVPLQKAPGGLFPGLNRLLDITGMREQLMKELPTLIPSAISALAEGAHHAGIPGAGLVSVGADVFGAGADVGLRGGAKAFSRREMQKYATLGAPILNALEAAQMGLAREDVQGFLKDYLPSRAVEELVGFSTAEGARSRGITELLGDLLSGAGAALDRSAAQQVNVSGTGRIMVDVRAPEGTRVDVEAGGLFKSTEISRMTQMLPADYGPLAATGINAGTGV